MQEMMKRIAFNTLPLQLEKLNCFKIEVLKNKLRYHDNPTKFSIRITPLLHNSNTRIGCQLSIEKITSPNFLSSLLYTLLLILFAVTRMPAQRDSVQNKEIRAYSLSAQGGLYADNDGLYGWTAGGEISYLRGKHVFSFSYRYMEETPQQNFLGPMMEQYDMYTLLYGMYFDWKERYRFQFQTGLGRLNGYRRETSGEGFYSYQTNRSRGIPLRFSAAYLLSPQVSIGLDTWMYFDAKRSFYWPVLNLNVLLKR